MQIGGKHYNVRLMILGRGLDSICSGWGPLAGLHIHGDELYFCEYDGNFLVLLNPYHHPKTDTVPWTSCRKNILMLPELQEY
jgi:hypothetical protein